MSKETIRERYDFIVAGGGLSGVCAAIAAARHGLKTALIHNRPVLGGNASSEIRMHVCGAAGVYCVRGNARETGIIEEILLENKRRNPYHNFSVFDTVLWEKVRFQKNLTLYLNCHVYGAKTDGRRILSLQALQMTTEKHYEFMGALFADTTGDAMIADLTGCRIMRGTESHDVFGEPDAPKEGGPSTMGNTLLFKAIDRGVPVSFKAPIWANKYSEEDLRYRDHKDISSGYWWIELGGTDDTIRDYEQIRDELLKSVYGVWDHIKNGGDHGAENWDLDWVQFLPGKRESRRVAGDLVLTEHDLLESRIFEDAVAYGGWPIDTHTPMGIKGRKENANRFIELKDVYTIPYRCLYAADMDNLLVGGRAVSASHLAFASLRVMGTTSVIGQAIGTSAALIIKYGVTSRELYSNGHIQELQQMLLKDDCFIPGSVNTHENDHARKARIAASSYDPDFPPENLQSGVARPVKEKNNQYRSAFHDREPQLTLTWTDPVYIKEVLLKFDSDLDHDLMISIDQSVVDKWRNTPPLQLIKAYRLDLMTDDKILASRTVKDSSIRNAAESFDEPVYCNKLRVTLLETYGSEQFHLFEVRVY